MATNFTFLNYESPAQHEQHRHAIRSHVSGQYRRRVRRQTEPKYALPHKGLIRGHKDNKDHQNGGKEISLRDAEANRLRRRYFDLMVKPRQTGDLSIPNFCFGGTRVDPFNSYPTSKVTACVANAIDYYIQVFTPSQSPMYVALNIVNPLITWIFPLALQNEELFHGIVALGQTYCEEARIPGWRPSREVLFHRGRAVAKLREKLGTGSKGVADDAAIVTILLLASLDIQILLRDMQSLDTHRNGLGLMVASRGGLDKLGRRGLIKSSLVQFEYFWLLETGGETVFSDCKRAQKRSYPQHPFPPHICTLIAKLPLGFRELALEQCLGTDVLQILGRISDFIARKDPGLQKVSLQMSQETEEYPDIYDACSILKSSPSTEHSVEKHLCLAIILFSINVHSRNRPSTTAYRGSRQELAKCLPDSRFRSTSERECLIWIWMVMIESWTTKATTFEPQVMAMMRRCFEEFPETRDWNRLEPILRKFFWHEPLARAWKECFDQTVLDNRSQDIEKLAYSEASHNLVDSDSNTDGQLDALKCAEHLPMNERSGHLLSNLISSPSEMTAGERPPILEKTQQQQKQRDSAVDGKAIPIRSASGPHHPPRLNLDSYLLEMR